MQIVDVIKEIENRFCSCKKQPYIIAIDGMSASGKTTLGQALHDYFPDSNLFHMDDYFLQPHQRTEARLCEIGGNVDYERFKQEVLDHLSDADGLLHCAYDCQAQSLRPAVHTPWQPLVIIEGAYSQHPFFEDTYQLRIFCEITPEEQRKRILARNGEKMLQRFETEWIPKENAYFAYYRIKEKSDLLLK